MDQSASLIWWYYAAATILLLNLCKAPFESCASDFMIYMYACNTTLDKHQCCIIDRACLLPQLTFLLL